MGRGLMCERDKCAESPESRVEPQKSRRTTRTCVLRQGRGFQPAPCLAVGRKRGQSSQAGTEAQQTFSLSQEPWHLGQECEVRQDGEGRPQVPS